jgi:CheY-like chemotaxis protein
VTTRSVCEEDENFDREVSAPKSFSLRHGAFAPAILPTPRVGAMTEPASKSTKTVLCVDDDPGILGALQRVLRRTPYNIVCALGPQEGLELAKTVKPDLILLDIMMPGMTGKEFAAAARRILGDLPIVFLTGYNSDDTTSTVGSPYCIQKPFSNRHVRNVVDLLIGDMSDKERRKLAACIEGA